MPRRLSLTPSRSRSRTPKKRNRRDASATPEKNRRGRSRSFSPRDKRRRDSSRSRDTRDRSRSRGRKDRGSDPPPSKCLGIFGLSERTTEKDVMRKFDRYPGFSDVKLIKDYISDRNRGFGFVNFESIEDAQYAKDKTNGCSIDGRIVRVAFSLSQRAVTPTPGVYMGKRERPPPHGRGAKPRSNTRSRSRSISRSPRR